MTTGTRAKVDAILRDPAGSDWLKAALRAALRRDILDAYNDARILAEVLGEVADAAIVDTFAGLEVADAAPEQPPTCPECERVIGGSESSIESQGREYHIECAEVGR